MKNIFLIPTDKPSRLYIYKDKLNLIYSPNPNIKLENTWNELKEIFGDSHKPQNIYITSDEVIKEGWKGYAYKEDVKGKVFKHSYTYNQWYKDAKQIVLTNDTSLIEDGVQEIPSQFLSFFAENPVDYVRVEKWLDDEGKRFYSLYFSPKKETEEYSNVQKKSLEDNRKFVGNTPKKKLDRLMSEFENLEGITSDMFDEKDWSRFNRFVENCEKEETEQKVYTEEEVKELLKRFAPHIRYNHKELPHTWSQVVQEWFAENKK